MFKNGHCSFSTTTFFCKRQYFFSIQLNGAKRLQRKSHISNCRSSTDPRILYSPDLLPDGKECQTHYHHSIYEHTSLLVSFSVAFDTKTKQTNKSVFSQAFEANASSSGGIQTLIDIHISQDDKITTFYELQK